MEDTKKTDLAETYVLGETDIRNTESLRMTGILKELGDAEIEGVTEDVRAPGASTGHTIDLFLDDDDL